MEKGHKFHLNRLKEYFNSLKPKIIVPFASYIYFCKESNKFLNKFSVKPHEVISNLGSKNCQLVYLNDEVFLNNSFENRNPENLGRTRARGLPQENFGRASKPAAIVTIDQDHSTSVVSPRT